MNEIEALINLNPLDEVTIRKRTLKIEDWEDKTNKYSTTIHSCGCTGFSYRSWCNHQGYLVWKQKKITELFDKKKKDFLKDIYNFGGDADILEEHWGMIFIQHMIDAGNIYEARNIHKGRLFYVKLA